MNVLHIVPQGGIANRVRAIISAQWMTERLGTELAVTWHSDAAIPASWNDLYEGPLPSPPPGLETRETLHLRNPAFIDPSDPAVRAADVVELRTCMACSFRPDIEALSYRFWAAVHPHLRGLTPCSEVRSLVDPIADRFGTHVLGVHIRTGGGAIGFKERYRATREAFFDEINRLRDETPGLQIYLASDAIDTAVAARARFGAALITMDDHVERDFRTTDTVEDLQVALAEIVLLSRTQRVLGTYYSSFAALAGAMGALPYKEMFRPDGDERFHTFKREAFEVGD
jgi:hypothetical protein